MIAAEASVTGVNSWAGSWVHFWGAPVLSNVYL